MRKIECPKCKGLGLIPAKQEGSQYGSHVCPGCMGNGNLIVVDLYEALKIARPEQVTAMLPVRL